MGKTVIIETNDPYEGDTNGAVCQEMALTNKGSAQRYRIRIRSESYENQSYATLEAWTGIGFSEIIRRNPKKHYGIEAAYKYKGDIPKDAFGQIMSDFVTAALRFERGYDIEENVKGAPLYGSKTCIAQ